MTPRREFHPLQAVEIAAAFQEAKVEYLFLGKGGAILLGFPGTTQDVDVFVARSRGNGERIHSPPLRSAAEVASERAEGGESDGRKG